MKRTSFLVIAILVLVGLIVGYFVYITTHSPWDGLSCEEMFDFAMSSKHQDLTMDQHMAFHKNYDPCIENP